MRKLNHEQEQRKCTEGTIGQILKTSWGVGGGGGGRESCESIEERTGLSHIAGNVQRLEPYSRNEE